MTYESTLPVLLEVAVAIAGFSGIVAALMTQRGETWGAEDRASFRFLIAGSGAVGFFAVFPLLVFGAGLEEAVVWRVSSYLMALVMTIRTALIMVELRGSHSLRTIASALFTVVFIFATVAGGHYGVGWPYVAFLVFFLGLALFSFGRFAMRLATIGEGGA